MDARCSLSAELDRLVEWWASRRWPPNGEKDLDQPSDPPRPRLDVPWVEKILPNLRLDARGEPWSMATLILHGSHLDP